MIFDAKTEQKKFWGIFDEKLIENGEPFSLLHEDHSGEPLYWGAVNKRPETFSKCYGYCFSIDFLTRERKLRINIFIRNDLQFFSFLEQYKREIDSMVSVPLCWVQGEKNSKTRRIAYYKSFEIGDAGNYAKIIDEVLPIIMEIKSVCEIYGKYKFFDL